MTFTDVLTSIRKIMSDLRFRAASGQGHGNGNPAGGGGGGGGNAVQRYAVTASSLTPVDGATITITAQAKNNGNSNISIAGRVVTWSKTGAGGSFSAPTSTTNSSGVATVQFTVGAGGVTHTVTATDTAGKTGTSSPIVVLVTDPPPPTVDHYAVTASDLAPVTATQITITAQAKDVNNVNVAEAGRTITWSKSGAGGSFASPTSVTNSAGIATVGFTVGAGGVTHTVTATDGDAKTGTSSPILVQAGAPPPPVVDHYAVSASNLAPTELSTIAITAQAKDANNVNVAEAGRTVTWSKSGAGGSFSAPTSITNASGIASVNFTVGAGGVTHTVTATDGSAKTGTSSPILVQASAPPPPTVDHYAVTPSTVSPLTGTVVTMTAQAKDVNNVNVAEAGRLVTWSKTGSGGFFSQATSLTNASGIATVNFTVGAAGVTYVITATDSSAKTGKSPPIVVQTPAPVIDHYAVSASTSTPQPGSVVTITAQAKDASNNNVLEANRTITWSKSGSGGSFAQATSVTNSAGVATVNFTVGAAGVSHTVTATDTIGKTGTSSAIVVQAASGSTPQLPRIFIDTTVPSVTGVTRVVSSSAELQPALDAAQPGDEIVLANGVSFSDNYFWRNTWPDTTYVTLRSATPTQSPDVRQRPSTSASLAKIIAPNISPAIFMTNGAHHLWIQNVEVKGVPGNNYALLRLGDNEAFLSLMPHHIVVDRCYVHGASDVHCQNAIVWNCYHTAIINSWIAEVHWAGFENHAVAGWASPGPFKLINNTLEAASINFLYGGAPPATNGLHPGDFEIRRNHMYKPVAYFNAGYGVKNIFEFKHGQRAWVRGNVFERSWADAQVGYAINMQSGGDSKPPDELAATSDITFEYNTVDSAQLAYMLSANPWQESVPVARVVIRHSLFTNIGPFGPADSSSKGFQLLDNFTDLVVEHNTLIRRPLNETGAPFIVGRDPSLPVAQGIILRDNIVGDGISAGGIFANGGLVGKLAMDQWCGPGNYVCTKNVFFDAAEGVDSRAIPGNYYAANEAAVGFNADWSLSASSPYRGGATDGTDPGINRAALNAEIAGVVVAP